MIKTSSSFARIERVSRRVIAMADNEPKDTANTMIKAAIWVCDMSTIIAMIPRSRNT